MTVRARPVTRAEVLGLRLRAHHLPRSLRDTPPGSAAQVLHVRVPYDAYLAQPDRAMIVPDPQQRKAVWRAVGNPGVLLVNGEVRGVWRSKRSDKKLTLTVEPFGELSIPQLRRVQEAAQRLAPFRGATSVTLDVGSGS